MPANKFVLKHNHIESRYVIGATPELPTLIYEDGPEDKKFRSPEVATTEKFSTIGVRHKIRRAGLPSPPPAVVELHRDVRHGGQP